MTEADYKKLSLLIAKYCPDFVVEDHPKFISFLKAYYDWSANVKEFNPWRVTSHLIEWGDIDETLDEFIDYFKQEYLNELNTDFNGDIREFLKHTKEFYASRGTPESFKFLLQLLSGNSGEIFYPNQYLMKSSDGEWVTDKVLFVEYDERLDNSFISTRLKGKTTGNTAVIETIETHFNYLTQDRFLKIYVSNLTGDFHNEDAIIFKNDSTSLELTIYKTIKSVNLTSKGNNYQVGDTLSIQDDPTFICKVESVSSGKIDSYAILDGGTGYSVGDVIHTKCDTLDYYSADARVYVDEVDPDTGAITSLDIRYPGYGFLEVPSVDYIESATHIAYNDGVPSGYTPLTYIENDGLQYLNLGMQLSDTNSVDLKFKILPSANPDINHGVFGANYLENSFGYMFLYNEERRVFISRYGLYTHEFDINIETDHYIKREKNKLYLDNTYVADDSSSAFNTINYASLFATTGTNSHTYGKCRIYFCRIWDEDNNLIKNYVPVKRNSDDKIGIFETVEGVFLTNESGTDYVPGPESVIIRDAEIEFISDGAGAINSVGVISAEINYTDGEDLVITSETGVGASATISTGEIFTSIPYYYKPGSFLSDDFKLQDSDYWQEYSYEIRSSLALDSGILQQFSEYKDIFKKLVHPAGFKLFNSFVLSNHIDLDLLYINSTISFRGASTFLEFINWIELVSYWNRIVDNDIIFQHRFSTIADERETALNFYKRTGGEFVHSNLEIETIL